MGRPRKEIKQDDFEKLCALQCTEEEICAFFDVTDKTLASWCKRTYCKNFSEVFKEKRKIGHISLRRSQFRLAEKSATMAIFLGKNYLNQRDAPIEIKSSGESMIDKITVELFRAQHEEANDAEKSDSEC